MHTVSHQPDDLRDEGDQHVGSPGSYVLNAAYIVVFFLAYVWMFVELSQRWPVR